MKNHQQAWAVMAAFVMAAGSTAGCGFRDVEIERTVDKEDPPCITDGCTGTVIAPFQAGGDRDDCATDPNRYPGAAEIRDGIDNDCDGLTDAQDPSCTNCPQLCGVHVLCTTPPPAVCQNSTTLTAFEPFGECTPTGACIYTPKTEACPGGCVENPNGPDACAVQQGCTVNADCTPSSTACRVRVCMIPAGAATGTCVEESAPNNTACDDGAFCTVNDRCMNGVCTAGAARSCAGLGSECATGACNETADRCEAQPVGNGTPCGGGSSCVAQGTCQNGVCQGAGQVTCDDNIPCTVDLCDQATGQCVHTPNDNLCNDNLFCNGVEVCDLGDGCIAGTPPVVNDNIPCTADSCNEATDTIIHVPQNAICSDGLFCNGQEVCNQVAGCQAGTPVDCSAQTNACNRGVCNEGTDSCTQEAIQDGGACDDGQFCTVGDRCIKGLCSGVQRDCSALGGECHDGLCDDRQDQCVSLTKPNGTACSDQNPCTTGETCQSGTCAPAQLVQCADPLALCNPGTGQCVKQTCNPDPPVSQGGEEAGECAALCAQTGFADDPFYGCGCIVPPQNQTGTCGLYEDPDGDEFASDPEQICVDGVDGDVDGDVDECNPGFYCDEATTGNCRPLADCSRAGQCNNFGCNNTQACGGFRTACITDAQCASGLCQRGVCYPDGLGGAGIRCSALPVGGGTMEYIVGSGNTTCAVADPINRTQIYRARCPDNAPESGAVRIAVVNLQSQNPVQTWVSAGCRCLDENATAWSGRLVGSDIFCDAVRP